LSIQFRGSIIRALCHGKWHDVIPPEAVNGAPLGKASMAFQILRVASASGGEGMNDPAKVAVVDDDDAVRKGLAFQLRTAGFKAEDFASAREFLTAKHVKAFDCVVADIYLPTLNGLQLQKELERILPYLSIVFVTGSGDLSLGIQAMRGGAVNFLEKPVNDEQLLTSVAQGVEFSRARRAKEEERARIELLHHRLTPREREVFILITKGLLNKQVGAALGATERTIKEHRGRVMRKMRAESLADLVRMAVVLKIHETSGQS
jgi:FixJ family two-component response regulator